LRKVHNSHIISEIRDVPIDEGAILHTEILRHNERSGRKLLYIHGSGTVGNHTIVKRPSLWLIDQDLYDTVILPDRRGCGASSPWEEKPTLRIQAEDMKDLLDALGIEGPVDVAGISYGGPIALTLAYLDDRIQRVLLVASSPTLGQIAWPWNWLIHIGLVPAVMKRMYKREIGKAEPKYIDYDFMYEMEEPTRQERWEHFKEVLRHTPEERLDSVLYEFNATLDPSNAEIPDEVRLDIPVLQVIGSEDETWGSEIPEKYRERFSDLRQRVIRGADHGDAIAKADVFHESLRELLLADRADE